MEDFVKWCDSNYLNLNVKRTKGMIVDFRKEQTEALPIVIKSENVERVSEYKYLGFVIDDKLTGTANTKLVYSKCIKRVHYLRILRNIKVDRKIITLLYKSVVESVLCFSLTLWYGALNLRDKSKLRKIIKTSCKLGADITTLDELYKKFVLKQVKKIMKDNQHPLHGNYVF